MSVALVSSSNIETLEPVSAPPRVPTVEKIVEFSVVISRYSAGGEAS
jgi:hypothetical protein